MKLFSIKMLFKNSLIEKAKIYYKREGKNLNCFN